MIRSLDEGVLQLAVEERVWLLCHLDSVFLQALECLVKVLDAEADVIDGMALARFQAVAALPGLRERSLGITHGIDDEAHIVHQQTYRRSCLPSTAVAHLARWR